MSTVKGSLTDVTNQPEKHTKTMRVHENHFILFITALDYIEEHLTSELSQEEIAASCYCSLSSLQKTWKICTHMSVGEYITKRRLTMAGRDMLSGMSVLDAAMKSLVAFCHLEKGYFFCKLELDYLYRCFLSR